MPRAAAPKVVYVAAPPRKKAPKKKHASRVGGLRGHGDYTYDKPGPWGRIGRSLGEHAGGMVGASYGAKGVGSAIGGKLGSYLHYIGKIFGSGDYVTSPNAVKNNILVNQAQIPQFSDGKNSVRIAHREYICDIVSHGTANTFRLQSFPIQPGLASSFPWLANVVGGSFQQYRINGMVYEFRTMSADALNSVNTALGQVIMATDYDSKDANFSSKQQMENTEFGVSCKPSSSMIHAIECARNQTSISELYVRPFAVPSGADQRLYDMGNFQIATNGVQGTSVNLGELWVSYDITFFKTVEYPPGYQMGLANYLLNSVAAASPLGVGPTVQNGGADNIGLTLTSTTVGFPNNTPIGTTYELTYYLSLASSALTLPAITVSNGFTILAGFKAPSAAATTTIGMCVTYVQLTSLPGNALLPTVTYGAYTGGAAGAGCYLDVYQISGAPIDAP
nr:putative capsid protein [Crucivirus sp.]